MAAKKKPVRKPKRVSGTPREHRAIDPRKSVTISSLPVAPGTFKDGNNQAITGQGSANGSASGTIT